MKHKERIKNVATTIVFVITVLGMPYTTKVPVDEEIAETLLKEAYQPVITFVMDLEPTDDPLKLKVPDYITSKDDFAKSMSLDMNERAISDLYNDMIFEESGELYADSTIYIPMIYDPNRKIKKAYIKIGQPIINKFFVYKDKNITTELIVKEVTQSTGEQHSSSRYEFRQDDTGKWYLNSKTGNTMSDFVDPSDNPWNEMRRGGGVKGIILWNS